MSTLRVILGDQLSRSISSLKNANHSQDIILISELLNEATYVKHHKKKITFLFSCMRHFAAELKKEGFRVIYTKLNDKLNTGKLSTEIERVVEEYSIDTVVITEPAEHRLLTEIKQYEEKLSVPVKIKEDDRFLCPKKTFADWYKNKKNIRMEFFYRKMRQKYGILMENNQPIGGKWNYDAENRKFPKKLPSPAIPYQTNCDTITTQVKQLVKSNFKDHFGDIDPFHFAVNRKEALSALEMFINSRLQYFGDYQDAMIDGEPWMFHSHISSYLNCGLLLPLECAKAAERAYYEGRAPLNAAEGFIRQIIGWREFIRGVYWLKMPEYKNNNFMNAHSNLPHFYWSGKTSMRCLNQCINETKQNAYAHHIQRLMVLGNFALIAGVHPKQVSEWFLIVYADAYEWVELPNVLGMALHADGGYLASKPYAAGGSYINRMSNYCKQCQFNVKEKSGPSACPFNYLYWNFIANNRSKLEKNHRMAIMYKTFDKMSDEQKSAISEDSKRFLSSINNREEKK